MAVVSSPEQQRVARAPDPRRRPIGASALAIWQASQPQALNACLHYGPSSGPAVHDAITEVTAPLPLMALLVVLYFEASVS